MSRGVLASVGASVAFAGIYFVTPFLAPANADFLWAVRSAVTIPIVVIALLVMRQWHLVTDIAARMRRRPLLFLGLLACGALIGAQLWIFGWAPLNGRGMQVALGYFLLPLVLVVVGRVLYRDRLVWWQWAAAAVAAIGVAVELVRVGGLSWETLLVALGYPVYFVLRRSLGTNHLGGMFWELALFAPVAIVCIVWEIGAGSSLAEHPALWWLAPLVAVWAGIALLLYLMSSRLLTLSVFGLLSYLEPALLVVASLLNGERIAPDEFIVYGAVWAAVLIVVIGGVSQFIRNRPSEPTGQA